VPVVSQNIIKFGAVYHSQLCCMYSCTHTMHTRAHRHTHWYNRHDPGSGSIPLFQATAFRKKVAHFYQQIVFRLSNQRR